MKDIVLAGGCFWGVEAYMSKLDGILTTEVGFANGNIDSPTYEQVKTGKTGYAEACLIEYDEKVTSLEEILASFWKIIDPTAVNKQGEDEGSQYRTAIYYMDDEDLKIIEKSKNELQKGLDKPIQTEVEELEVFFQAEEKHQKYLEKNPDGYCHIDLSL